MTAQSKHVGREQERESINTLRVVGGLLLAIGLLLYFFHIAEARFGGGKLGVVSAAFVIAGAALLCTGWLRMRALR